MPPRSFDFEAALVRLPRWMLILAFAGLPVAFWWGGLRTGTGFLGGALLGYLNFRIIERAVNRIARSAIANESPESRAGSGTGVWVFIQFGALALLAFGILSVSGINLVAGFWGFFVCPGAVLVEILYELLTYGHP